jgi:hypothetical protein
LPKFRSAAEAIQVLVRAERDYRLAMTFLTRRDSMASVPSDPAIYRARLAALDETVGVFIDAAREAPQDPVINGYMLSMLGARDAALRQLGDKLPPGVRLAGM